MTDWVSVPSEPDDPEGTQRWSRTYNNSKLLGIPLQGGHMVELGGKTVHTYVPLPEPPPEVDSPLDGYTGVRSTKLAGMPPGDEPRWLMLAQAYAVALVDFPLPWPPQDPE